MGRTNVVFGVLAALLVLFFIIGFNSKDLLQPYEATSSYPWTWLPSKDLPRMAYMLYATDARTVCNAIIMARNIRHTGTPTSMPIVTLVSTEVPTEIVRHLHLAGLVVVPVEPWKQNRTAHRDVWTESLTKLRIFQERGYDKVIYLDSDAWVHRNLDHLFALGDAPLWAPHAYYLTDNYALASTLLVFSPSNRLFHDMERAVANPPRPDYYDMDVLNDLFKLDCGYLPNHYVVLTGTLDEQHVTWGFASKEERMAKTYVTHFSPGVGLGKPWDTSRVLAAVVA
ncbi:hypothetical protein LEN26_004056 [Aphanomyces euteiches]|nr:hypothetical protein LEN26_004056 [Aphanomyces euteiches]